MPPCFCTRSILALSCLCAGSSSQGPPPNDTCSESPGAVADKPGLYLFQRSSLFRRKAVRASVDIAAQLSDGAGAVVLTYCDDGFKDIWPVFSKCYTRATSCAVDGYCHKHGVQLLDLGLEGDVASGARHCTRRGEAPPPKASGEGSVGPALASLLQVASGTGLTPKSVPRVIAGGISSVLALRRDVLRIDADAFLLRNPFQVLRDQYPRAHIISSVDCAFGTTKNGTAHCGWYRKAAYWRAHNNSDPLADVGFMVNTGLMYVRSSPVTVEIARLTERALEAGTTYEQIAFNEVLLQYGCRWAQTDGKPVDSIYRQVAVGKCAEGLEVVVLPYAAVTRSSKVSWAGKMAFHPGSNKATKLEVLPAIDAVCGAPGDAEAAP